MTDHHYLRSMNFLNRPYVSDLSRKKRVIHALTFGAFVFLFLLAFKPFGLEGFGAGITWLLLGYGVITCVVMLGLNVGIPFLFPGFFGEERWTTGREIIYTALNILAIGACNYLYTVAMISLAPGMGAFMWFIGITLLVALFPTSIVVLLRERVDRATFSEQSNAITASLRTATSMADRAMITLRSANVNDSDLALLPHNLCFIKAADNYAEVWYTEGVALRKTLLRTTLKELEDALAEHPEMVRCHKSYLVNLDRIERVTGNAQGYRLQLRGVDQLVPVSRTNNATLRQRLADRH